MAAEVKKEIQLEIAHVLFTDIVGYSKLPINQQRALVERLNEIVRGTDEFQAAEKAGRLITIPTGDGITLVFYDSPETPAECALEISRALKKHPELQLRMGIHSGPVSGVIDATGKANVAGAGINIAQRVMDCGDAGHILLSKHVAEDLEEYPHWKPHLQGLGECEVKHGIRISVVNLRTEELGNSAVPEKLKAARAQRKRAGFRWLSLGLVSLLAVIAAISFLFLRYKQPPGAPGLAVPEKSIAVLPFENLSDEQQNAYFTDGVQDEILNDLSRVADLKVISRTSVMPYKSGGARNLREIAKALGVSYIVEGSVQRAGGRVRVSAQLIDARADIHIWGDHYDRDLADVFALESDLAEKIVAQLKTRLSPTEKAAIEERPTGDLGAYDLYLRGKNLLEAISFNVRASDNLFEAAHLFGEAVARDPSFLLAYCQLARAHDEIYFIGADHTQQRLELAEAAINNAFRIRPDSGEAHLALGHHLYVAYRDRDRALSELEIARRSLPNEPLIFLFIASIERRSGKWEESNHNFEHALELDPRNFSILQQLSLTYEFQRRYVEMSATLKRALEISPDDIPTKVQLAAITLESQADPKPLHAALDAIIVADPHTAGALADQRIELALCERDWAAAQRALAMTDAGCQVGSLPFSHAWCIGALARVSGDTTHAHAAFIEAETEIKKILETQPDYPEALCVLGLIEAALGNKTLAIGDGRRAVDLLPLTKDAVDGAYMITYLALIYAWCGDKKLAIEQLEIATRIPSDLSYGQLRLHPYWDPLRGDPRFEALVASLAPKSP
jgi:TolB-like protein/class 3 adenylate cyclase/Tfp pilus assembly protein PilF